MAYHGPDDARWKLDLPSKSKVEEQRGKQYFKHLPTVNYHVTLTGATGCVFQYFDVVFVSDLEPEQMGMELAPPVDWVPPPGTTFIPKRWVIPDDSKVDLEGASDDSGLPRAPTGSRPESLITDEVRVQRWIGQHFDIGVCANGLSKSHLFAHHRKSVV